MSDITEDMYLLAKKVVAEYEAKLNKADAKTRNYSFGDMNKCFSAGIGRGCFVASVISGNRIDEFDDFDSFIKNNYARSIN